MTEPLMLSQLNCEDAIGLPPRQFLELTRRPDAPPVLRVGKRRLVDARAFLAFLATVDATERAASTPSEGAEGVLAEVGLRLVRGAR